MKYICFRVHFTERYPGISFSIWELSHWGKDQWSWISLAEMKYLKICLLLLSAIFIITAMMLSILSNSILEPLSARQVQYWNNSNKSAPCCAVNMLWHWKDLWRQDQHMNGVWWVMHLLVLLGKFWKTGDCLWLSLNTSISPPIWNYRQEDCHFLFSATIPKLELSYHNCSNRNVMIQRQGT